MQNILLEIDSISKGFLPALSFSQLLRLDFRQPKITRALEDISFSLKKGQTLAILGPNGAGKTTLLKIISTLILPDSGKISINGYSVGKDDERIKSLIGLLVDEERSFYWRLTGRQNLEFFAALYGFTRQTAKTRINELLGLFEVDYGDKRFDSYSTGMKKRFALIRALIHNPELLLLDEPTKSLDYASAHNLRGFINQTLVKDSRKTVIVTTHQLDEALELADRFIILNKGKICASGSLNDLRSQVHNPQASLSEIFLGLTKKEKL